MDTGIIYEPFMGHLTGESIRAMLQARADAEYQKIARALAPAPFLMHGMLSSAIAVASERQRNGS